MSSQALGYVLFVVCTGVLFVRPTELVDDLNDAPLYEAAILAGLAISAPRVLRQLSASALVKNPATLCVMGLVPAVALSHLSHLLIGEAARSSFTFLKVALSYLFLLAVLNSTVRLQRFLGWIFAFISVLTILALLQNYEAIDNPALAAHRERLQDKETGEVIGVNTRLSGAGIFANPNDLSRILVVGIALALYFFDGGATALLRPFWLATIGVFGHALLLTQSRGGFTALLATFFVLGLLRLGTRRTLLLAGMAVPILGFAIEGRQTDLSTSDGTGQQRIRLWSDGLDALKASPAFGIGMGNYSEITGGLGAHNSFVHAYVELGFFGGTLFAAAVFCALWSGTHLVRREKRCADPQLRRVGIYLVAILAGYAVGMMSSSRCYAFPTYYLLGLVTVYARLARADVALPTYRVTPRNVVLVVLSSMFLLAAFQLYVMSSAQFGTQIFQN